MRNTQNQRRDPLAARAGQEIALAGDAPHTMIALDRIRVDGGTQMRAGLDDATVAEYAEAINNPLGWPFPAIVLFHDGTDYWLGDGFHRVAAARQQAIASDIPASAMDIPAFVHSGTRRDAILYAASANATHGLRRTNADKRRAVETLLRDEEWSQWSNREIARRCHVDEKTVRTIRAELTAEIPQSESTERVYTTRHGTTATMNTANIGANPPRAITYGALCLLIEREIAPTCDLWPADMDWLIQYIGDAVRRKNMTASEQDIMTAIIDTREDLRSREGRENRLIRARAAAEAADAERSKSEVTAPSLVVKPPDMPEDLAAAGWELRSVHGVHGSSPWTRWWCYNAHDQRATDLFDAAQDAIDSANTWQRSLLATKNALHQAHTVRRDLAARGHDVEQNDTDSDPYDHDTPDAIRNDLAAMDNELDPAAQERYRLTIIERALLELARSFGRGRFSVTINLGDEEPEWSIRAWEPGYPMDGTAHLHEAVSALREQLSTAEGS